ncbi:oxygen-dependent coproporphyrinogen-III oxidase, chloroplastic-like [Telopea speciosissima]|uniref:oxygen-dependent coproporphyrinogen-III oxidase, chloroplastic-like n=1 Tax=Telopea speciosissima TaxID=54955 RepID=UPI001CC44097|nr:oxygen-dependent coproporphyrinogen-III oxidase, chloroplastic-like [Telopea speciosissima]
MPTSILSISSTPVPHPSHATTSSASSPSSSIIGVQSLCFFPRNLYIKIPLSMNKRISLTVRSVVAIEKETPQNERPDTFLRESDGPSSSIRARFEKMIRNAQDSICAAVEAADGGGKFKEDVWSRAGGGGGISRVLQDGGVWEKAGVNVSVVYGMMPPEAYRAAKGENFTEKPGPVPFFAAGISSVLHPKNPFAPTLHFNYRYFETDAPKDAPGAPRQWWFGGGTDLTPAYIFEEDVKHFHRVQKNTCDKFDPSFYPRFKKWCDDYFFIKHRGERRGLGGIFFDDLNDYDQEMLLAFASECANSVAAAYIPIIERRKDMPFTDRHKEWQQLRRGRYVEFNLVYDRGTTFGLKTGGRIESILVSLPLTARWEYDHQPEEGSEEWKLLDACINPKEWI